MKKYFITTFGCQMNKSDSERISAKLKELGYQSAPDPSGADLIVINMCSVRQSAVDRVYGRFNQFKKLKKQNSNFKTLLTGCVLPSDLKKFKKYFNYILSIKTLPYWEQALSKNHFYYYPSQRTQKFKTDYLKNTPCYQNNFSAYVPISIGCDNFCSYCVVPYTRGPLISRSSKDILAQIKNLVKKGFKEIWLIGENVNSWKVEKERNSRFNPPLTKSPPSLREGGREKERIGFPELLRMVNEIPGDFWISFTSSHPKDFSDKLIKTMKQCAKVTDYISLPIQSGDNQVLKAMNRPYKVSDYKKIVKKIRKSIPDVYLSTDIIVGFPEETKKQFANTAKLFKELRFDMAYIAEYSPRRGTTAFKVKDNVSQKEKQQRREILTKILEKTAIAKNKKYIGKTIEVLISNVIKNKFLVGKTKNYKTVKIVDLPPQIKPQQMIGRIAKAKVIDIIPWGLKAELESGW